VCVYVFVCVRVCRGECPDELWELMTRCWCMAPKDRPLFSELVVALGNIRPQKVLRRALQHAAVCLAVCYSARALGNMRPKEMCCGVCCSVLQCLLQCVRARKHHCTTLQKTATHCTTLQRTATQCNALQHPATCHNTRQHTATRCYAL